jgi:hypothetical protein
MHGDVSGRFQVFGEQGFVAGAIDLKYFTTALVGDEVFVVDGVVCRCVWGVIVKLRIRFGEIQKKAQ